MPVPADFLCEYMPEVSGAGKNRFGPREGIFAFQEVFEVKAGGYVAANLTVRSHDACRDRTRAVIRKNPSRVVRSAPVLNPRAVSLPTPNWYPVSFSRKSKALIKQRLRIAGFYIEIPGSILDPIYDIECGKNASTRIKSGICITHNS